MMYPKEPKQTMWEIWFTLSIITMLLWLFIGTIPDSIYFYPNWPLHTIIIFINLMICSIIGFKKH